MLPEKDKVHHYPQERCLLVVLVTVYQGLTSLCARHPAKPQNNLVYWMRKQRLQDVEQFAESH